jgi:T-complex protein 1 subunit eta
MKKLQVVHPAGKTLVDISLSQDAEVGDGTTSVVLLAGEFLRECKPYVEEGVHPQVIVKAFREACRLAVARLGELSVKLTTQKPDELREMLVKSASTSLSSKLVSGQKAFFANMVVDAVLSLGKDDALDMIGMKKVPGGALQDSMLVEGVAFKKTFSYAGFEQMTKHFSSPKIALLNIELELKAERDNAEVRVSDVASYQKVVDAEWDIIYSKLAKIVDSGANIVLSRLAIGDLATQYFADRGLFCAGRVEDGDLRRVQQATGAVIQTSVNDLRQEVLGNCSKFEERQVGGERFNFFSGCELATTCTIILRGGAEQFIEEAERSLHDAIMNTRRLLKHPEVIAGGGAIEMEISAYLRERSRGIYGKQQLLIAAFAKALEVIPRQVATNAGIDSTDVLNKLRMKHAHGGKWFGVDVVSGGICDTFESFVWEASVMKRNALAAATEAACLILSVDETVRNPSSEKPDAANYNPRAMRGVGMRGHGKGGRGGRFPGRGGR